MRGDSYGKLLSSYWTGPTGRAIQARGKDATLLGVYLFSCRHANMAGLFEMPLGYVDADLPVLGGIEPIRIALAALVEVGFAHHNENDDHLWVVEMARVRFGLTRAGIIDTSDKRHAALLRWYHSCAETPLLDRFYERYAEQLVLGERRPIDGPPKGHARGIDAPSMSRARLRAGASAISNQQSAIHGKNALRAFHPVENPKVTTLAAMVRQSSLLSMTFETDSDLMEAAKRLAARFGLKYNSKSIAAAIDSARAQRRKRAGA